MTAIALDTNLLLLLVIGRATGEAAGKRLKGYDDADLDILEKCLTGCDRIVVTPNVWTEISNICGFGIEGTWLAQIQDNIVQTIHASMEIGRPSSEVTADPEFGRLGLTDCVWLAVLDAETTLLTDDLALCNTALSRGLKAVNFNHLRDFG